MPYYSGDYYSLGDPGLGTELVKYGKSALGELGERALGFLKSPAGKLAAVGAGGVAAGVAATKAAEALGGEERRRYRRMNVLNPRALRRSMRRVQGFARFARKTMAFTKTHRLKRHRRR